MKRGLLLIGMAFAMVLAIAVANRMSADAMAVVIGVACGVLASVPTSLLIVWALGRRGQTPITADQPRQFGMGQYPPIVVVNPGSSYGLPGHNRPAWGAPASYPGVDELPLPAGPRTFKVVGQEETPY